MKESYIVGWYCFFSEVDSKLVPEKSGKWTCFFKDQEYAISICRKAIEEGVCDECKCRDISILDLTDYNNGVICFYLNSDDIQNHKRILEFMIHNNLIRRTKTGRLYNISFKYDYQTRAGEYGDEFMPKLSLDRFVDLNTGKWIYD